MRIQTEDREKRKEAEMRGFNGESRAANNTLETINAAATAIASAENRVSQATVQVVIIIFLIFIALFDRLVMNNLMRED